MSQHMGYWWLQHLSHIYEGIVGPLMLVKELADRIQGVATKYLDNYLYWFNFLQQKKKIEEKERINKILLCLRKEPKKKELHS
ncbi:hypothetical protein [Peribacillus sp. NPDC060253]|uniref:hypothetical protein n=1 Tax=Peribacillus sp. NPDC060253 TaxID=3347084 RepID=UPI00365183FF